MSEQPSFSMAEDDVPASASQGARDDASPRHAAFAHRLNIACDHIGLAPKYHGRHKALAQLIGKSQKAVRKWLEGLAYPTSGSMLQVAQACGVRFAWLVNGDEPMLETDATLIDAETSSEMRLVPLLEWAELKTMQSASDIARPYLQCPIATAGPQTFALRADTEALGPKLQASDVVYVDPERVPKLGDIVLIAHAQSFKLRRLAGEGNERSYTATDVPTVPETDARVIGVVAGYVVTLP